MKIEAPIRNWSIRTCALFATALNLISACNNAPVPTEHPNLSLQIDHVQHLVKKWKLPIDYEDCEISSENIAGNHRIWLTTGKENADFLVLGTGEIAMVFDGELRFDRSWIPKSELPFDMDDARALVKSLSLDPKTEVTEHQPYTPEPKNINFTYVEPNRKMTIFKVERSSGKILAMFEDIAGERPVRSNGR